MILKPGVTWVEAQPSIFYALGIAEMVYKQASQRLVVTSLTDSHEDRPLSLHNKGLAADLRRRGISKDRVVAIHAYLRSILDPMGYDVVLESDHIHFEYDPKGSESWWKLDV